MHFHRLLRAPAPTVIGTFAVSLAALTSVLGVAWSTLLRPLPFADSDRLVILQTTHTLRGGGVANWRWSYPRATMLQREARSFAHVAPYHTTELTVAGDDDVEAVQGEFASPDYFAALRVQVAAGRMYTAAEDAPSSGASVVVLSDALWRRRFGGSRDVLGTMVRIQGVAHEVVGIMPPGFRGVSDRAALWLPMSSAPRLSYDEFLTTDQDFIDVVARLAPGVTMAAATAELRTLVPRLYAAYPDTDHDVEDRPSGMVRAARDAGHAPGLRPALAILVGAVLILHLLACANVVTLLLGHTLRRAREFGVRIALGCGTRSLALGQFRDVAVLVVLGGAVGTGGATLGGAPIGRTLVAWLPPARGSAIGAFAEPAFSWIVIVAALTITLLSAVLVAAGPALLAARIGVATAGRGAMRGASPRGTASRRVTARGLLLAGEMSLALSLCTVGALMFESFDRMRRTDIGVAADSVLTFGVRPDEARVPAAQAAAYIDRMLAAIAAVPGVSSASVDGGAPVSGTARTTLEGGSSAHAPGDAPPSVLRHYVAPAHFRTLGIPLVRGRSFDAGDVAGRPGVAVISESAARRFWPTGDPIGQRVWFGAGPFNAPETAVEIVGIVGDVVYDPLDTAPNRASFYTPYAQFTYADRTYFVRTSGEPTAIVAAIRRAVRSVDPQTPLTDVRPLRDVIGASWSRQQSSATLYLGFALFALVLSASGVAAVVAHAVTERTREVGIRLALGSQPAGVVMLMVRDGIVFPLAGIAGGLVLVRAFGSVLRASLYGVGTTDGRVLGGATLVLLLTTSVAALIPALRAARVDPARTLRAE